jgi:DNA gyrase/topoisomerase IV subunit B
LNGLKLNVIALAGEVDFSSQTKERLTKLDGLREDEVAPELSKEFIKIMRANKEYFDDHVERLNAYAATLTKISTINKIKSSMNGSGASNSRSRSKMPEGLVDAISNNRKECELFITEGKSAGGNIVQARTLDGTQAVIQLRGVPMNAVNADLDTFLDNPEMQVIYRSIGAGVNEFHDISNSRYGKIIIATDADPDGYRIAALVIGMFAKKMTFLIENGMVYFLETPIYKQGTKYIYQSDDIEKELDTSKPFIRYKGLGKFNVSDLKIIATGKDTRRLVQVTLDDAEYALTLLTSSYARKCLMIEKDILIDPFKLGLYL